MSIAVIVFLLGCGFIAVALIGGGLEVRDIRIPRVGTPARILIGAFGAILMALPVLRPDLLRNLDRSQAAASTPPSPPGADAFVPRPIADWTEIDRISAFRLGQWAALISGYDYDPDPNDDAGYRPWRNEAYFLKRAIQLGEFKPSTVTKDNVNRTSLIRRDEITAFYRSQRRYPRALFPGGH